MRRFLLLPAYLLAYQLCIAQLSPGSSIKAYFDLFPAMADNFEQTHARYYPATATNPFKAFNDLIDDHLDSLLERAGTKSKSLLWTVILHGRKERKRGNTSYDDHTVKDEEVRLHVGRLNYTIGQAETAYGDEATDSMNAQLKRNPHLTYGEWNKAVYMDYKKGFATYFNAAKKTLLEIDSYLRKTGFISALWNKNHKYHIQLLEIEANLLARLKELSDTASNIDQRAAHSIEGCNKNPEWCATQMGVVKQP
jgi:hypothetical protein